MSCSYFIFTNNPVIKNKIKNGSAELAFVGGTSLDVLKGARDSIHLGAKLVTHPLYGNLRPYQQPYRTILACRERNIKNTPQCDIESLSLIERAIEVYQSCIDRLVKPDYIPGLLLDDYAFVDFELMRESFSRVKLI